jgi:hypothetical protein
MKTLSKGEARRTMPKPSGAVPHLVPVSPPPGWAFFSPFDGYPYLLYVPGRGYALVFIDCRFKRPDRLDEAMRGPLRYRVGARRVIRCGRGWLVLTVPFAGVRWRRNGTSIIISISEIERLQELEQCRSCLVPPLDGSQRVPDKDREITQHDTERATRFGLRASLNQNQKVISRATTPSSDPDFTPISPKLAAKYAAYRRLKHTAATVRFERGNF